MTEALTRANQPINGLGVPMVEAANKLGFTLVASAAMLQGKLSRGLPAFVATALGLQNDVERALQFVRSTPGITTALVGMSRDEHVRANLSLVAISPASKDEFSRLFERGKQA
jgi:predicted aldo/keto reductase-like oxidoreductase